MATPPLLAILLVTSSELTFPSKHLLFHYPPHPSPSLLADDDEIPDDSSSDVSSASSSSSSVSSTASLHSSKYSRLASENTAPTTATASNHNHERYTIEEDEEHHDGFDRDEEDDRLPWRRKVSRLTEWEQPLFTLAKRDLADILIPKDSLCNRKFELGIEDLVFLGHPVHLAHTMNGRVDKVGLASSPSSIDDDVDVETIVNKVKLSKFHVVFVMNPSWRLDYHEQVQKMYTEVIKKFTDACITEQKERGYISLEAVKIHKIKRDAEEKELPMSLIWEQLIQTSNLAHAISTLYNSIIHNKVAFVDLNHSIELAFHIKQISQISSLPELGTYPFDENNIPLLSTAHGFGDCDADADQVLAPKYTLLLLHDRDEILKKVPTRPLHKRQSWTKFLTIKPTITFQKLSREQKLPLPLVMSMARELIDLDFARPIPPLSNRAIYIVSPISPISSLQSQSRQFRTRFSSAPSLSTLLSSISSSHPRRWSTFVSQFRLSNDVLPYLIRAGWLIQLSQFYFIRIPRRVKLACIDPPDRRTAEDHAEDEILVDPFRASREEARWIRRLADEIGVRSGAGKGRMFERLSKYFDGKSAKEKILRREQIERVELEQMIEAARKVGGIVIAEHW